MGDFVSFERFYYFDDQVRRGKYPNTTWMIEKFEIDRRTAHRTIEFMRDRLYAPLEFNRSKNGFYYSDESFELPRFQISQEEILALLIARDLLSKSAGGHISDQITHFFQKLISTDGGITLKPEHLDEMFSSTWVGHKPTKPAIFEKVLQSTFERRVIRISYSKPQEKTLRERDVEPHHLQHYMGDWMLIAWCHFREEWRRFSMARIEKAELLKVAYRTKSSSEWKPYLDHAFGLFQGGEITKVVLHFNEFRSEWIKDEIWHSSQTLEILDNSSTMLTLPVSAFPEIKMRILQYGADVEVLKPESLRDEILQEAKQMQKMYECDTK